MTEQQIRIKDNGTIRTNQNPSDKLESVKYSNTYPTVK